MPVLDPAYVPTPVRESREAVRQARELRARYEALAPLCGDTVAASLDHCATSWGFCQESPLPLRCLFYLRARVHDRPCLAIWRKNTLVVHPELRERAELLVRLGETFELETLEHQVAAGLSEPLQAALTLLRASDQVLQFDIRLDQLELAFNVV